MFSFSSLAILGLLTLIILFWYESLRIREHIIRMCKSICRESDLQLLDQTVSLARAGLSRADSGWPIVHLVYSFEVSSNGTDRLRGYVSLAGRRIIAVQIENNEGSNVIYPHDRRLIR